MNRRIRGLACGILVVALLFVSPAWGAGGDLLWETPFTFSPENNNIIVNGVGASATSLIICGIANNLDSNGVQIGKSIGFIKAFDVSTGIIKWDKTLTLGANANGFSTLVVDGNVVLVNGSSMSFTGNPPVYSLFRSILRSYNADTGQFLWEVIKDFESSAFLNPPTLTPITVANNRAFVVKTVVDSNGKKTGSSIARAYQVKTVTLPLSMLMEN